MTTTAANPTATPSTRELVEVDPATLVVDLNVSHDTRLDPDFCASITEHGVLVPVVDVRTADGALRVPRRLGCGVGVVEGVHVAGLGFSDGVAPDGVGAADQVPAVEVVVPNSRASPTFMAQTLVRYRCSGGT